MNKSQFYNTVNILYFDVQLKATQGNFLSCCVVFTFSLQDNNYTDRLRLIQSYLGTGVLYPSSKYVQRYYTTKQDVIRELIDACIKNDPSDKLAFSYKNILKQYKNFNKLNSLEKIAFFVEVDRFNYKRNGLKPLPNRDWLTAFKVCKEWLRKKPMEKEVYEDLKRFLLLLELYPMYKLRHEQPNISTKS